jgi:hypothetical protein
MSRPNLIVTAVAIVSVFASGCSAERAGDPADGSWAAAIGTNARTEQVDALGFAIVLDGEGHGRVVGTLLNTERRSHAVTGAAIKSDGTPVRTALLADIIRLPPQQPVNLLDAPMMSVPATDLSAGSFVELTLDISDGEIVEMLVPVEANEGPYAEVDVVATAPAPTVAVSQL